jgi:hypothetical protein
MRTDLTNAARRSCAVAILAAVAAAGCGSSNGAGTTGAQSSARGLARDPKVTACLKKQGVSLPQRPGGRSPSAGGTTTTFTRPARPRGNPERFRKLRAALAKCGVTPPQGRPGGGAPASDGN